MTLVEALAAAGVGVTVSVRSGVHTAPHFNRIERCGLVERENLLARFKGHTFLIVAISVYLEGDIAEEWCVSAGSPPGVPRTLYLLRNGNWVFLNPNRTGDQWTTIPLDQIFVSGVSDRM